MIRFFAKTVFVLCATSFAFAAPAPFDVPALKNIFSTSVANNGPNCYNTTLLSLGYVDEVIHISPDEMNFYLHLFCKQTELRPEEAANGYVIVFRNLDRLAHTAAALGKRTDFREV
jgi:hypothetical protein